MRPFLFALMLTWAGLLQAADLSEPLILVAKPELRDSLFGSTILVVKPVGGDQHVGFIVNRPTGVTLGKIFPEHGPSQKLIDSVYLGGRGSDHRVRSRTRPFHRAALALWADTRPVPRWEWRAAARVEKRDAPR